jgi:hypothetical protein
MSDFPLSADSKAKQLPATAKPIPSKDVSPAPVQPEIIPVGHEPRRHPCPGGGDHREAAGRKIAPPDGVLKPDPRAKGSRDLRNPKKFFGLKDRLDTLRIFTLESMGTLRKSEIQVWLAIFNCEFNGLAQIGYSRLCEVTKLSRRHVGKAVASLESNDLLEVVVRGRYRPSRSEAVGGGKPGSGAADSRSSEAGLASTYRVQPRPHGHAKQAAANRPRRRPKPR